MSIYNNLADTYIDGDVKSTFFNKNEAPMESTLFKVRVDLMPASDEWNRCPHDIVMVLDVSSSMAEEDRLKGVKVLARTIINRMHHVDRLSVIVYEGEVYRLCKLQKMTDLNKVEILSLIDEIAAGGGSNVNGGLREAMKVIDDRKFTKSRDRSIVLMSDGDHLHHADGSITQTYSVPVYTIQYGHQPQSQVGFPSLSLSLSLSLFVRKMVLFVPKVPYNFRFMHIR